MTKLRIFFCIAVLFIGLVFWWQNSASYQIDRCLDGGGRWDYDTGRCDP